MSFTEWIVTPLIFLKDFWELSPIIMTFIYLYFIGAIWSLYTMRDDFLGSFIWFIPFKYRGDSFALQGNDEVRE